MEHAAEGQARLCHIACVTPDQLTTTWASRYGTDLNNSLSFYLFISKLNDYGTRARFHFLKTLVFINIS